MAYAVYDFSESITRVKLPSKPVEVLWAWGDDDGDGGGTWRGGFAIKLADNTFALVTGWCDYTGWGCQDGADVSLHSTEIELLHEIKRAGEDVPDEDWPGQRVPPGNRREGGELAPITSWDFMPEDLNLWIKKGMNSDSVSPWASER